MSDERHHRLDAIAKAVALLLERRKVTREQPPPPQWVQGPVADPLGPEQPSSVMHPRTGTTRRMVGWASAIAAVAVCLQPLVQALADRLAPPPATVELVRELRELRQQLRDGGVQ